jgi:hypothetical protein
VKGDKLCPYCYGTGKRDEWIETEHQGYKTRVKHHGVVCKYKRKKDYRRIVLE